MGTPLIILAGLLAKLVAGNCYIVVIFLYDGQDKQATAVCAVKINVYITTFGCY